MKILINAFLLFFSSFVFAQKPDTVNKLNLIIVKGYYNPQPLLRSVSAVNVIDSNQFKNQGNGPLLGVINVVPGVRMEERSPGSYRLSMRGSLLRSPFGIRNIKIYIDEFPLTDAGGNTYLNLLDVAGIGTMEIFKGPESSNFGANTGGAVLIHPSLLSQEKTDLSLTAGSYGLFHQTASITRSFNRYQFNVTEGYQRSDGYRENSALSRKYIQTSHKWDYSKRANLKAFIFYSDLAYETPGGLTVAQMEANPKSARLATPTLPSAVAQKAGIYNKTIFAGLANQYQFNSSLRHVVAVFSTYSDFKNPFITNYEKREESTFGFRTFIEYQKNIAKAKSNLQLGVENSNTKTIFRNYNNDKGTATSLQASDDLKAQLTFAFLRLNFDLNKRLLIELGSSLNFYGYEYESFFPLVTPNNESNFKTELMPKFAGSYLITSSFSIRASASKGYSPPTLAEVRSSDQVINTSLQAETGWNYETGLRYETKTGKFYAEATGFYFNLKDAIVRRLNSNDLEYFINAGATNQKGLEVQFAWWLIKKDKNSLLNGLLWRNAYTFNHFEFEEFKNAAQDYSGNKLTGVPDQVLINSLELNFKKGWYFFAQHNFTSSIPLNDANTIFASKYHLVDFKTGINSIKYGTIKFDVHFGINNLFDQHYSLGNDLNAMGNRYFNPSMGINFFSGVKVSL